jgi:hypothetical protein
MGKQPTPETPKPAPFFPIDIAKTGQDAINADQAGFATSDADFQKRFPGLALGRTSEVDDAYKQLTGPLDPNVQSSFVNQGLSSALTAFGGGSPYANVTGAGTAGKKAVSSSVANDVSQKQDYDRSAFNNLITTNLPRAFGLSGSDAANLSIANTGNLNATNQANYAGSVATSNARNATDAANQQAAVQTGVAIAGIIAALV